MTILRRKERWMNHSTSLRHAIARRVRTVSILRKLRRLIPLSGDQVQFQNSAQYWNERYERGGNSGEGSYGPLAQYKASFINDFCRDNRITSAVEFGCGDGNQASLFEIDHYLGIDISEKCIARARKRFSTRAWDFQTLEAFQRNPQQRFELGLSLDVIYHLVEDDTYLRYLDDLFATAERFVLIYASNFEHFDPAVPHVRHRPLVADAARLHPGWRHLGTEPNPFRKQHDSASEYGSFAEFHVFGKQTG
jgi:SAM-dependent methyltransferase